MGAASITLNIIADCNLIKYANNYNPMGKYSKKVDQEKRHITQPPGDGWGMFGGSLLKEKAWSSSLPLKESKFQVRPAPCVSGYSIEVLVDTDSGAWITCPLAAAEAGKLLFWLPPWGGGMCKERPFLNTRSEGLSSQKTRQRRVHRHGAWCCGYSGEFSRAVVLACEFSLWWVFKTWLFGGKDH